MHCRRKIRVMTGDSPPALVEIKIKPLERRRKELSEEEKKEPKRFV